MRIKLLMSERNISFFTATIGNPFGDSTYKNIDRKKGLKRHGNGKRL